MVKRQERGTFKDKAQNFLKMRSGELAQAILKILLAEV